MKKTIIVLCFLIIVTESKSQMWVNYEGLSDFLNSTVYVPTTGQKNFDDALQNAFSKFWKITPYKISSAVEYAGLEKKNEKKKEIKTFLFNLKYEGYYITNNETIICKVSSFYQGTEGYDFYDKNKKFDHLQYRIDYIIKLMNDMVTITRDNKLNAKAGSSQYGDPLGDELCKLFSSDGAKKIKDKTLILNKDMKFLRTEIYDEKLFSKLYPYPFKFVSEAEFNDILKGEQKEYVCFVPSYNLDNEVNRISACEFVYEPATRSTIYMWNTRDFNKHIKKTDIEQLKKTIAK